MKLFLIILFTMLAILSPVLWLRPSRRESRLGALRQTAKAQGISISFEKPPLANASGGVVAYRWHYPQGTPGSDFTVVRDAYASERLESVTPDWRWRQAPLPSLEASRRDTLEAVLNALPEDALVLESGRNALTLWWEESREPEDASRMFTELQALVTTLAGSGRSLTTQHAASRRR
ncbi:preprotein translocase subunit YajC [Halomonas sp. WWR20]